MFQTGTGLGFGAHFQGLVARSVAADAGEAYPAVDPALSTCRTICKPMKLGDQPKFAFLEQPQTNGVAERFIRAIKEQVIYGRVFQNLQEVRQAVRRFVGTYNCEWLVEKNGFKSPWQARHQWLAQASLARAA
jgi:transposase InsO family protein